MRRGQVLRTALAGAMIAAGLVAAAPLQGPLAALGLVSPGEWQLKEAGTSSPARSICVADPQTLVQLNHPGARCTRFVIEDLPRTATVHYTCPGAGHGRTTVSVESASVIHVQTQGIVDGAPFDFDYQGRRMGNCPGSAR